ncbi:MAG: Pyridoxal-5-phosphate-dependent protein beta subunit [Actinomycetia bacterium]|nr:Pyridoxal-5-phosphate-dependent protein beta subunit [Actinomycetes bacterium]
MTPLDPFRDGIWLKREDEHQLGAFKWRGALATLEARTPDVVVTASTGNHGAATAWAARRAGARAIVFVPEEASAAKIALIEAQGAELRRAGVDMDEAKAAAKELADREGWFFFEDGAEPAQFDGYAAIGDELLDQLTEPPGSVVVPVGNGALAIGVFRAIAARAPSTERVAVSAAGAPAMLESWLAGRPTDSSRSMTFADGLAVRVAIPLAVAELNPLVQRFELVTERELARAVGAYAEVGIRAEGAAAAPLAVALRETLPRPVVLIVTGRNIDDGLWRRAVETPDSFAA